MAEALAARYAQTPWVGVYASPQLRTRQTAEPLCARAGLSLALESGLREIAYGAWEGMLEREVKQQYPDAYVAWAADPARVAPPGGETALEVAARASAALDAIRARHQAGQVLVVAHKATIRVLVCALLGIDVGRFRDRVAQPVGALTVFDFKDSGPLLQKLGDVSHLPPELVDAGD
jgi:probable phosphoglycerate mutase